MKRIFLSILFIVIFSIISFSQGIRENIIRVKTPTEPFREGYSINQLIRISDSVHLFALTRSVSAGQTMQEIFDSGWYKQVDEADLTFYGGEVTKVPIVGTIINSTTVTDWIQQAFYDFIPATISLSSSTLYEIGTSNTKTLTSSITANSETVFTSGYINQTSPAVVTKKSWLGGGTQTVNVSFTPTQGVSDSLTKTFRSYELVGNNGTPTTISSNVVTLSSCYPYLYGMSASDLSSGVGIYTALTKIIKNCATSSAVAFNSNSLKYAYFIFPATCGDVISILDQNGFEQISAFTKYTVNISSTGLTNNWTNVSYKIYKSNNTFTTLGNSWTYTFYQ